MKKIVYLSMMLLGMTLVSCSSENDEPEPEPAKPGWMEEYGWHSDGDFIGKFNVEYFDGDQKVGEGYIDTKGWLMFGYIPADYIIPEMMPEGRNYTLTDGQAWGGEEFGYLQKGNIGQISVYTLQQNPLESKFSLVSGTYENQDVMFTGIYDNSDVAYYKNLDAWEGSVSIKGLLIVNPKTGKEVEKIEPEKPFTLKFRSIGRASE